MKEGQEEIRRERVLLVGVDTGEEPDFDRSMEELKSLAEACEKCVAGIITQRMAVVNKALYIGAGKAAEVKEYAKECEAGEIVFDNTLSPSQVRNLGREIGLPILDRTNLILDIFALRARSGEAKLQVEMARLQYMLPRLVGMHEALSRQGGTSGSMSSRGVGEKKLELDRRKIEHRIGELKRELQKVERSRQTQRKKRMGSGTPQVALVGYTNAGKSTLLNRMLERYGDCPQKTVLEKDMLFATLETSVRGISTEDNRSFFLADTVGFIHKLPHGLVKAFRSTLEEVRYADLLVHVVDFSDEDHRHQMQVTEETLKELEAGSIPRIEVYNKADKCHMENLPQVRGRRIYMSATEGLGIEELAELIGEALYGDWIEGSFLIPYDRGEAASRLTELGTVLEREYREEGIWLRVKCRNGDAAKYERFRAPCGAAMGRA